MKPITVYVLAEANVSDYHGGLYWLDISTDPHKLIERHRGELWNDETELPNWTLEQFVESGNDLTD